MSGHSVMLNRIVYVYRLLFQAQICGAMYPVDLSLERLTTRFSVSSQSMPAFSNTKLRGRYYAQNRLPYLLWLGCSPGFCLCLHRNHMKMELPPTKAIAFPPLQKVSVSCYRGFWQATAKDVCMESTGKYWIPVYNILETDCKIVLAHPKYVKAIRGKKTDKKGCQVDCRYLQARSWFPAALFLLRIFVSFGIWFAITQS